MAGVEACGQVYLFPLHSCTTQNPFLGTWGPNFSGSRCPTYAQGPQCVTGEVHAHLPVVPP